MGIKKEKKWNKLLSTLCSLGEGVVSSLFFFFIFFNTAGDQPKASHMLGMCSAGSDFTSTTVDDILITIPPLPGCSHHV
jgi:hypothetical protein